MAEQELLSRISVSPKVMGGKPVIKGTRLTVEYILNVLSQGATVAEILIEYESLIDLDISACLLVDNFIVLSEQKIRFSK